MAQQDDLNSRDPDQAQAVKAERLRRRVLAGRAMLDRNRQHGVTVLGAMTAADFNRLRRMLVRPDPPKQRLDGQDWLVVSWFALFGMNDAYTLGYEQEMERGEMEAIARAVCADPEQAATPSRQRPRAAQAFRAPEWVVRAATAILWVPTVCVVGALLAVHLAAIAVRRLGGPSAPAPRHNRREQP